MNPAVATGSAIAAAALFATATVVQAKALRDAPQDLEPSTSQVRTVIHAFRSPVWLGGTGIAAIAFGLHALALHDGNLSFVQPLLVTMVIFALPVGRAFGGPIPRRSELSWAVLLILGLAAFFAAADPIAGHGSAVDAGPAVLTSGLALLTVSGCVMLAGRHEGTVGAALLGAAAGICFAGVAALLKTATDTLAHDGIPALFAGWQLYALLVVGAIGIVLSQLAYKVGPLSASLPALNSVNPLASVVIGVAVFDEHFRTGAFASTAEALGLIAVTMAVVTLSRPIQRPVDSPSKGSSSRKPGSSPNGGTVLETEESCQ